MCGHVRFSLCGLVLVVIVAGVVPTRAGETDAYQIALARITAVQISGDTALDLKGLGLTALPPEIGLLVNLEVLSLRDNALTTLPPQIGQLTDLRYLYLNHNQLARLPVELGTLDNLNYLLARDNRLGCLDPHLSDMDALLWLLVQDNPLIFPPPPVVERGTAAILAYLHSPDPYPPHRPTLAVMVMALLAPLLALGGYAGMLAYLRRCGSS